MRAGDPPAWATSSCGESTEATPVQMAALGEHMTLCSRRGGRFSLMVCGAELARDLVRGRLVTMLTVLASVSGVIWLIAS
jgi:hypothetical protein